MTKQDAIQTARDRFQVATKGKILGATKRCKMWHVFIVAGKGRYKVGEYPAGK